jgi:hypothetical protein
MMALFSNPESAIDVSATMTIDRVTATGRLLTALVVLGR